MPVHPLHRGWIWARAGLRTEGRGVGLVRTAEAPVSAGSEEEEEEEEEEEDTLAVEALVSPPDVV
ncbi:hypothetical protein EYF80_067965 [Liparis tanakae]|uniref:Uncharacterized protein n=1 Tax=Liparis tanakae TaxID=230148 RepID=A0A4Z2DZF6_9TELE|nr:hypothetical protein EYF80_067965 [Liparis tanakae]